MKREEVPDMNKEFLNEGVYWLKKMAGLPARTGFPYDRKKTNRAKNEVVFDSMEFKLSNEIFNHLQRLSKESYPKLFMILVSGITALLYKYSGNKDIIVGAPIYKQKIEGEFINTILPFRNRLTENMTFKELLIQVRQTIIEAVKNQNYSMETLLYQLKVPFSTRGFPLFDVVVLLENLHDREYIRHIRVSMTFSFVKTNDGVEGLVEFDSLRYEKATIERMISHFSRLLALALADIDLALSAVDIMSNNEREKLLMGFNKFSRGTDNEQLLSYGLDQLLHKHFEQQVKRTPGNTAVVFKDQQLTYSVLNQKAHQAAQVLRQRGVSSDTIVAMMAEPSIEMAVGILGIMKAGAAYLPIDPNYPGERIDLMLKDSAVKILVTSPVLSKKIKKMSILNCQLLMVNEMPPHRRRLNTPPKEANSINNYQLTINNLQLEYASLAYVIYTSGSTGKPKGVLIEHRGILNYVCWRIHAYKHTSADISLQMVSFSFDGFGANIYPALLSGGKVVFIDENKWKETDYIRSVIREKKITNFSVVPSLYRVLLEDAKKEDFKSMRFVVLAGEKADENLIRVSKKLLPQVQLINEYGPTEASVTASAHLGMSETDTTIIGKPIVNNGVYILDENQALKPLGVPGELCISGTGLARGYLNNPQLTAEKFVEQVTGAGDRCKWKNKSFCGGPGGSFFKKSPLAAGGKKIYKTGDLVRWLPQGVLELVGRKDDQEQIRGFRIEPGEIETRLRAYESITQAVVLAKEVMSYKVLCAYIAARVPLEIKKLRDYLANYLPDYMIPTYFVQLEQVPLTPNGKIDKQALLQMKIEKKDGVEYTPPRNPIEEKLVQIWKDFLELEVLGIKDDFFNIGGDSIKSISLLNIINKEFNINLELVDLYENETVEKLAARISSSETAGSDIDPLYEAVVKDLQQLKTRVLNQLENPGIVEDIYPMSDVQKGMIYYTLKDTGGTIYYRHLVYRLNLRTGNFDWKRLDRAFALLARKHSMLRTGFNMYDFEVPVQIVYKPGAVPMDIAYEEISHLDRAQQVRYINSILAEDRERPFDIRATRCLWWIKIFNLGKGNIWFVWFGHHAIIDGWSNATLMTELNNTYLQLESNPHLVPEPLKSSYKDFIIEQTLEKRKSETLEFWKNRLEGYKRFEFPGTKKKDWGQGKRKVEVYDLDTRLLEKLRLAAETYKTSIKHLCFGAYIYMLNMLSYENEIVVGLITHNRPVCEDGDKIIGCFLNTVPVRIIIPPHQEWRDYVAMIESKLRELNRYNRLSLYEIVEAVGEKTHHENPILDTFFNFIDYHVYNQLQPLAKDESANRIPGESDSASSEGISDTNTLFDFTVDTTAGHFRISIVYVESILSSQPPHQLLDYFETILNKMIGEPDGQVRKEEIISPKEKQAILDVFNKTTACYPGEKTIHQLFAGQTGRTPDHIAVIGHGRTDAWIHEKVHLTYRELNDKANQLAHLLIAKGVQVDTIVSIIVERSVEMIIGILGILKSGGAYLPLDPEYPEGRIQYMLTDSSTKLLVTAPNLAKKFAKLSIVNCQLLMVNEVLPNRQRLNNPPKEVNSIINYQLTINNLQLERVNLAYIIYTSGSTGRPKGVMVEHQGLVNLMKYHYQNTNLDYNRVTQFASISFDVSFQEIFFTLLAGGTLVVLDKQTKADIPQLCRIIRENRVQTVFLPISFIKTIFSDEDYADQFPGTIDHIVSAGEQMVVIDRFRTYIQENNIYLHNHYGPSETHVVTSLTLEPKGEIPELPSIGKPINNTKIYILDKALNLQPIGVVGELYIGGAAPGRGYLNNPGLTSEKFIEKVTGVSDRCRWINKKFFADVSRGSGCFTGAIFSKSAPVKHLARRRQKIYKTGDLGRWRPDGNIEFLGRIDNQVKIRGYRIELEEIETRLSDFDDVRDSVVVVKEDKAGEKFLCAYIVSEKNLNHPGLRNYLSGTFPGFMIPAAFVRLDTLPKTPGGKVDRKSLQDIEMTEGEEQYTAPRDEIEEKLAKIWSTVLGKEKEHISIDSDFFRLGGHSLRITTLIAKIHKEFQVKIPMEEVFLIPTISGLSHYIKKAAKIKFVSIKAAEKKEYYKLSSAQKRLYVIQRMDRDNISYNIAKIVFLDGELDREKLDEIFKKLIRRHESLRTSFEFLQGQPIQKIHHQVNFEIEYYDMEEVKVEEEQSSVLEGTRGLAPLPELAERKAQSSESREESHAPGAVRCASTIKSFIRPFDPGKPPLLRVGLLRVEKAKHIFMVDTHHIISDLISNERLIADFIALYRGEELAALKFQYKDYSEWQNKLQHSEETKKQENYWLSVFDGQVPGLNLPTDFVKPRVKSFAGNTITWRIDHPLCTKLKELTRETAVTLYMFLLAVFNILLSKYGKQEDIVVGSPISGRNHADLQYIVGVFVNMLAIRNQPQGNKTFKEFMEEVKENTLNAFENENYQFDELVNQLGLSRDTGENPLFEVVFNMVSSDNKRNALKHADDDNYLNVSPYKAQYQSTPFNLLLNVRETEDTLYMAFNYSTALFKKATIENMAAHYMDIIDQVVAAQGIKLSGIKISHGLLTVKPVTLRSEETVFNF